MKGYARRSSCDLRSPPPARPGSLEAIDRGAERIDAHRRGPARHLAAPARASGAAAREGRSRRARRVETSTRRPHDARHELQVVDPSPSSCRPTATASSRCSTSSSTTRFGTRRAAETSRSSVREQRRRGRRRRADQASASRPTSSPHLRALLPRTHRHAARLRRHGRRALHLARDHRAARRQDVVRQQGRAREQSSTSPSREDVRTVTPARSSSSRTTPTCGASWSSCSRTEGTTSSPRPTASEGLDVLRHENARRHPARHEDARDGRLGVRAAVPTRRMRTGAHRRDDGRRRPAAARRGDRRGGVARKARRSRPPLRHGGRSSPAR